jgi:hypothetical protein
MRMRLASRRQGELPLKDASSPGAVPGTWGEQISRAGSPRNPSRSNSICRGGRSMGTAAALNWV